MIPSPVLATAILTALPYFLRLESVQFRKADQLSLKNEIKSMESSHPKRYDFIVVGAGTAGCVLARRLSAKHRVLLIEAGGPLPVGVSVPVFHDYIELSPELNDFYSSIPQVEAYNRIIVKTHGRMLGGSGSHNFFYHNRGNSLDYDNWAKYTSDNSWSYQNLLKFFKKSETYVGKNQNDQRGTHGPITVKTELGAPIDSIWYDAGIELGYPIIDANSDQKPGFGPVDMPIKDGRRQSSYVAYIEPILGNRRNLELVKFAEVTKLIFSRVHKTRVIGVKYLRHGYEFIAYALKEVILSAGSVGSPMILFKSGIGPFKMLSEANIPVIANLPVGLNLEDHQGVLLGPFNFNDSSKIVVMSNNLTEDGINDYIHFKEDGVLSKTGAGPQSLFVSTRARRLKETTWPDLHIFNSDANFAGYTYYGDISKVLKQINYLCVAVFLGRPKHSARSLGSVTLNVTAYNNGERENTKLAILDYKFLADPANYKTLREGIQEAMKIMETKSYQRINASLIPYEPCSKIHEFKSDSYWDCYLRSTVTTLWHSTGTCRMGNGQDKNSVVDSKLRVRGIEGLRVVDASIMPFVVNVNINAAVLVIAEKSAHDILRTHCKWCIDIEIGE